MNRRERVICAGAALLLLVMYVLPIWKISLDAPQYPGGLGMYIEINTITGENPHDLQNINGLNHYIGMKEIVPDAIPELKIMPWLVAVLIGLGLLTAALGKRWALYGWVGLFTIVLLVGLVDFYLWEYDYGHNLDEEHAIIKIPGMNYQPPLIGSKKLLNFVATSWPSWGGWAAFGSFAIGWWLVLAPWLQKRRTRKARQSRPTETVAHRGFAVAVLALLLVGCTPEPEAFHYGRDACAHCRMTIADARFAAQLVTVHGKVYKFDALECLGNFVREGQVANTDVHSLWLSAFDAPETLLPLDEAQIWHSPALHSPMGAGLAAFSANQSAKTLQAEFGGESRTWRSLLHPDTISQQHAGHNH